MMRIGIFIALLSLPFLSFGQVRKIIRKGNKEYSQGKYPQSEIIFRQAQALDTTSGDIPYNIGNSLFKQKKYEQALNEYQNSLSKEKSPAKQAMAFHNAGNALFKMQKYQESVDAYKKALKANPYDNETRYNLAVAQKKLKDQQKNNQNKNNQNNQQNKQNQKNDQNKDKDKNNQNNKDQNDNKKDNKDQNDKKNEQQPQPKISKQDADRMLDALQNGENSTQQRIKAQKVKAQVRKTDKNW